jgi:site-specific DNA-adenine methylase
MKSLRAPFPWFGGKSRAAHLVWAAFGDVPNYVEPFFGSGAVLLGRPTPARIETVNDIDAYLSNFWRAVTAAPGEVARWADWPVNEADLHARHRWLVNQADFREQMKQDPDFFDAKIAGWWVWGLCQWIGSGWCASPEWWKRAHEGEELGKGRRPHLRGQGINSKTPVEWEGRAGGHRRSRGIQTAEHAQRPDLTASRGVLGTVGGEKRPNLHQRGGLGVHSNKAQKRARDLTGSAGWEKRPELGKGGRGIRGVREQMPDLGGNGGAAGKGVHASGKVPKMDRGGASRMATSTDAIVAWMVALQARLRRVRVCCGDWKRVLGRSPTECIGLTGVFLDPPYSDAAGRDGRLYNHDDLSVAHEVREWALEHGDNRKLRIALCGYEGEHQMPSSWQCVAWKANGGYASSAGNHANAKRERIWFSPACLPVHERQRSLFTAEVGS